MKLELGHLVFIGVLGLMLVYVGWKSFQWLREYWMYVKAKPARLLLLPYQILLLPMRLIGALLGGLAGAVSRAPDNSSRGRGGAASRAPSNSSTDRGKATTYVVKIESGRVSVYKSSGSFHASIRCEARSAVVSGDEVHVTLNDGRVKIYTVDGHFRRSI